MTEKYILVRQDENSSRKESRDSVCYLPPPKGEENGVVSLKPTPKTESKTALCAVSGSFSNEQKLSMRGMGEFSGMRASPKKGTVSLPPQLMTSPSVGHTYRFTNTSAAVLPISVGNILGACGVIGTVTNSTVATWASCFQLNKVTVWPASSSTAAEVPELLWAAGESSQIADQALINSIPEGITNSSALVFKPPKKSLSEFWITSADSAAVMFRISCPIGSVIDVSLKYRLSNAIANLGVTVATAVLGTVYYLPLDGPASNAYVPLGVPSTH